jgi:hypothetical protein
MYPRSSPPKLTYQNGIARPGLTVLLCKAADRACTNCTTMWSTAAQLQATEPLDNQRSKEAEPAQASAVQAATTHSGIKLQQADASVARVIIRMHHHGQDVPADGHISLVHLQAPLLTRHHQLVRDRLQCMCGQAVLALACVADTLLLLCPKVRSSDAICSSVCRRSGCKTVSGFAHEATAHLHAAAARCYNVS